MKLRPWSLPKKNRSPSRSGWNSRVQMASCSLAELGAGHVRLGDHADEGVDVVDVAVDRLEPGGHRGAPHVAGGGALDRVLVVRGRPVAVDVGQRGDVEDVGVVDSCRVSEAAGNGRSTRR